MMTAVTRSPRIADMAPCGISVMVHAVLLAEAIAL
jgi:hypothetical protein